MPTKFQKSRIGILLLVLLLLALSSGIATLSSVTGKSTMSNMERIGIVHTPAMIRASSRFVGIASNYDEQIGESFAQNFTSLAYNVTAVAQVDSDGNGPAYLLNGLTNSGFWYQIGLAYDWNGLAGGFTLAYEVWNSTGASVFPTNGGGGVASFNGTVNSGDTVLLNLYFGSGSNSGEVVMSANDYTTNANAVELFTSVGANIFQGNSNSTFNEHGYFTGLMTEQYHKNPYYGNEQFVTYSNRAFGLSSGWLWIDEFNVKTNQTLFSNNSGFLTFNDLYRLNSFSSNNATENANAFVLNTGSDPVSLNLLASPIFSDLGAKTTTSFRANASGGTAPYTFEFFLDNNLTSMFNSNGNLSTMLNFALQSLGAHDYYLNVIDSNGYPASSQSVGFTVNTDPSLVFFPSQQTLDLNQQDTFSASVMGGSPPYTLAWYVNAQQIAEQKTNNTSLSYVFNATAIGNYTIYGRLTDSANFVTNSSEENITINQDPTISWTVAPQSNSLFFTNTEAFGSVNVAGGTAPFIYSWYLNGVKVSQSDSANYSFSITKMGQNTLQVNVSDSVGFVVISQAYTLDYGFNLLNIALIVTITIVVFATAVLFLLRRSRR